MPQMREAVAGMLHHVMDATPLWCVGISLMQRNAPASYDTDVELIFTLLSYATALLSIGYVVGWYDPALRTFKNLCINVGFILIILLYHAVHHGFLQRIWTPPLLDWFGHFLIFPIVGLSAVLAGERFKCERQIDTEFSRQISGALIGAHLVLGVVDVSSRTDVSNLLTLWQAENSGANRMYDSIDTNEGKALAATAICLITCGRLITMALANMIWGPMAAESMLSIGVEVFGFFGSFVLWYFVDEKMPWWIFMALSFGWSVCFKLAKSVLWRSSGSQGLRWENVGPTKPAFGQELDKPQLCEALDDKTEFTQQEWDGFGITNLRNDHFVKRGDDYFRPADGQPRSLAIAMAMSATYVMLLKFQTEQPWIFHTGLPSSFHLGDGRNIALLLATTAIIGTTALSELYQKETVRWTGSKTVITFLLLAGIFFKIGQMSSRARDVTSETCVSQCVCYGVCI